jgi:hypothetical protein
VRAGSRDPAIHAAVDLVLFDDLEGVAKDSFLDNFVSFAPGVQLLVDLFVQDAYGYGLRGPVARSIRVRMLN